jgi:hypothetical protein
MAYGGRVRGLDTPVSDFPKRLYRNLRGLLDDDAIAHRDWRLLVSLLGLTEENRKIVQESDKKTEVALGLWQFQAGADANGHALVKVLKEMGRFDAVKELERFLGKKTAVVTEEIRREFRDIDEAAMMGDIEVLEGLIGDQTGAELDRKFRHMLRSPLHSAVYYGHLPAVQYLVRIGFDVRRVDHDGDTPFDLAEDEEIILFLQRRMCTETTDTATTQPVARSELDEATFRGNLKQMEKLLKAGCPVDVSSPPDEANVWTPLHTAARRGDLHAVKLLVENGANIEETWDGYTAEDLARLREHTEVSDYLKKLRKQQKKEVEKVLEEQLTKLLGQTVTVVLDGDEEKTPNEFQIQSLILPEITQNISDMLQVKVTCLKSRDSQISIRQTRDLLFARDLIAYVTERNRDSTQVPSPSPERLDTGTAKQQSLPRDPSSIRVPINSVIMIVFDYSVTIPISRWRPTESDFRAAFRQLLV